MQHEVKLSINSSEQTVYGTLVMVPCDILAAQWLGCFKKVSTAIMPCRTCKVTYSDLKREFNHEQYEERN